MNKIYVSFNSFTIFFWIRPLKEPAVSKCKKTAYLCSQYRNFWFLDCFFINFIYLGNFASRTICKTGYFLSSFLMAEFKKNCKTFKIYIYFIHYFDYSIWIIIICSINLNKRISFLEYLYSPFRPLRLLIDFSIHFDVHQRNAF